MRAAASDKAALSSAGTAAMAAAISAGVIRRFSTPSRTRSKRLVYATTAASPSRRTWAMMSRTRSASAGSMLARDSSLVKPASKSG